MYKHYRKVYFWCLRKCPLYRGSLYGVLHWESPLIEVPLYICSIDDQYFDTPHQFNYQFSTQCLILSQTQIILFIIIIINKPNLLLAFLDWSLPTQMRRFCSSPLLEMPPCAHI